MYKIVRKYWWTLENIIKKHFRFVLLGIVINFILIFLILNLINSRVLSKTTKIGLIGNYTKNSIPEEVTRLLSRGLTKINEKSGKYEGDLAEKIIIKNDGKIYEIKLKKGIKWQDGREFTTKDINYNFSDVSFIKKNDLEGYFILKTSFAPFLNLLSIPITDDKLNGLNKVTVSQIEYDKEFIKKIVLDGDSKIIYRFYPNEQIALTAFKLGEINILKDIRNVGAVKTWKNIKIVKKSNSNEFVGIFFSFKTNSIVTEKSFRQALSYAINKKVFSEKSAYSSYSTSSNFYSENIKKYFYDTESAKNLYEKVNPGSKKKIKLTLYSNPEYEKYAKQIASSWEKILNVEVEVRSSLGVPYQWQVYMTTVEIPKDPDQYALWHSNKTFRFSNYVNLKIDKLLEDGRTEIDATKRKTIYADLQKTLTEDLPAIFLFYPDSYTLSY